MSGFYDNSKPTDLTQINTQLDKLNNTVSVINPLLESYHGSVQTQNADQKTLCFYDVGAAGLTNCVFMIKAKVIGREIDNNHGYVVEKAACFRWTNQQLEQVGVLVDVFPAIFGCEHLQTIAVNVVAENNQLHLTVAGAGDQIMDWKGSLEIYFND